MTRQVETPVFVALGRLDFAVPFTLWDDFRGPFANLTVHIFERSGHTPQLEEPTDFDERALAWLSAVKPKAPSNDALSLSNRRHRSR